MKPLRRLRDLLPVLALACTALTSVHAQSLRLRGATAVDSRVVERFTAGEERVRVLVVAKPRPVGVLQSFGADPIAARRAQADAATRGIRELLTSDDGDALSLLASGGARDVRYLWACNAVAAEVSRDTLETLRRSGEAERVVLDREVQWLADDVETPRVVDEIGALEAPEFYGVAKIGAAAARERHGLDGSGVVVGVIDTGIQADHPELAGKVLRFKDFTRIPKDEAYDDNGHGTHCAGTIAGNRFGVAPGAKLVIAKGLGGAGGASLSGLLEAMQWMLDPDGDPTTADQPDLVSNSWGAPVDGLGDGAEIFRDMVKAWREAGIVPVFASGNSGLGSKVVPGGYPEAFAVGATDARDQVAPFSTGGPISWHGESFLKPEVSAPGVDILAAYPGNKVAALSGTSMACPHVAGALALTIEARPGASVDALQEAFEGSSLDLGTPGKDARYGEGRIRVLETLGALPAAALP